MASAGASEITLDPAGNTLADASGRTYRYNAAGRLAALEANGAQVARYTYNHLGQRTAKHTAQGTTVYHYGPQGHLLQETTQAGQAIKTYLYADGAPVAQLERVLKGGRAIPAPARARIPAQATAEQLTFLHTDPLGTPRLGTDSEGTVIWRHEGEAFGITLPEEDPDQDRKLTTVNLRFPGQYYDQESGLHFNWNRYYDPRTGRYITSDPIGLRGGLNTYAYVGANALRWTDIDGLKITGTWIKKPWAYGLNVEYTGSTATLPQDWKWLPPSYVWRIMHFKGSAKITFEIECTEEKECQKTRTWNISPTSNVTSPFNVPLRHKMFTHWILTGAHIASAGKDAYKLLENWVLVQTAAYAAVDPTTWCLFETGFE